MDIKRLNEIRKLVIVALFSDDDLMDVFVLKGGNAISLVYELDYRASQDIDMSMDGDFDENKIDFWGGYQLEFKIAERAIFNEYKSNLEALLKRAITVREDQKKTFRVDISKYEFCNVKEPRELDGYRIYVYTPVMVIYEKLRAICQQMEAYNSIVPTHKPRARGRDFFDIHLLIEKLNLDDTLHDPENLILLKKIFAAKRVPLKLLSQIRNEAEFHRHVFQAVMATAATDYDLRDFDFYFDYVVRLVESLKNALGHKASNDH